MRFGAMRTDTLLLPSPKLSSIPSNICADSTLACCDHRVDCPGYEARLCHVPLHWSWGATTIFNTIKLDIAQSEVHRALPSAPRALPTRLLAMNHRAASNGYS